MNLLSLMKLPIHLPHCITNSFCWHQYSFLTLNANIQNLKTWKHNTGFTPEMGGTATAFGVDAGSYPMPAIYTFGFNLTF